MSYTISKFICEDTDREVIIGVDIKTNCYYIEFFLKDKLMDTRFFPNKNIQYVEDIADDYINGTMEVENKCQ